MDSDPARIPFYIAASTLALVLVIRVAGLLGARRRQGWTGAFLAAFLISAIGIGFAKFGAGAGLPWQVYYTLPMLATVFGPPVFFGFSARATALYLVLAFAAAPLIHAAAFYGLGWGDYMPFLRLPRAG